MTGDKLRGLMGVTRGWRAGLGLVCLRLAWEASMPTVWHHMTEYPTLRGAVDRRGFIGRRRTVVPPPTER
jgi:hypothetical protein